LKKQFTKPLRNRLNDRSLLLNLTNLTESTSQTTPFFSIKSFEYFQNFKRFYAKLCVPKCCIRKTKCSKI
jgi:hypothetical protein